MDLRNQMRIPFVVYDGFCEKMDRIANITIDNFDGGHQMGCHFRELGYQRALCISDNEICVDLDRIRGFQKGFSPGEVNCLIVPMRKEDRWKFYGKRLDEIRQVSAIFAVSDYYAIDMICFLNEQGIRVPEEISVAGFDDIPMCRMIRPALTTVRQDRALRAKLAIEKLRELKEKKKIETEICLPVSLIVRNSTKKARR